MNDANETNGIEWTGMEWIEQELSGLEWNECMAAFMRACVHEPGTEWNEMETACLTDSLSD